MEEKVEFCNGFLENYFANSMGGTHDFVEKYLYELLVLSEAIIYDTEIMKIGDNIDTSNYKKEQNTSTIDFTKSIVKDYVNSNNIYNLDIEDILKNHFKVTDPNKPDGLLPNDGNVTYDKYDKPLITLDDNNKIEDSCMLAHELSHYVNMPTKSEAITPVRDIFTEAIAYTEEYIFLDYLEKMGFSKICNEIRKKEIQTFKNENAMVDSIIPLMAVYKKMGSISLDNYKELYSSGTGYEFRINTLEKIVKENYLQVQHSIYMLIASGFSHYMYEEYKKDSSFIYNIRDLSLKICDIRDFEEVLHMINITGLNKESIKKIVDDVNLYLDDLKRK